MLHVKFHLPPSRVAERPSLQDGVSAADERNNLCFAVECMQQASEMMQLERSVFICAAVLLHRFYCSKSVRDHEVKKMAVAALVVACKSKGANNGKAWDVVVRTAITAVDLAQQRMEGVASPSILDYTPGEGEYHRRLCSFVHRESQLLRQLGFNCHVEDPQIFLLCFAKFLELDQEMVQCSWDYLLDSMRLSIHCYYPANVVVAACIYMSFRKQNRRMPKCNPPWWDLFDISEGDLIDVCRAIMGLYNGEVLSRYVALPPRPQSVEKGEVKEQEPVRKTAHTEGGLTRCVGETRNGKEQERDKDREMQSKGKKKENPIVDPKREMREKPRERDAERGKDWDKD